MSYHTHSRCAQLFVHHFIAGEAIQLILSYTVTVESRFDFLSQEYKDLFIGADTTAFQSPLWMNYIHKILMPNLEARQFTIVIRSAKDQTLVAVFPFVIQKAVLGVEIMQFADFGVCDYNAMIGKNSVLEVLSKDQSVQKEMQTLTKEAHLLLLRKIREDVFDVSRFFKLTTKNLNDNMTYNCLVGENVDTWEQENFSKSWLKNLRRRERKFLKDVGTWTFSEVTSEEKIHEAMGVIRKVHQKNFEDNLIQHDVYKNFYSSYIIAAIKQGEAVMYDLKLGDETIATEFGFLYNNSYQGLLVAAETEKYSKFSIGYQMIFKVIRDAVDKGYHNFDLGIGDQDYKQKFNAQEIKLYDYTLAGSFRGHIISGIYNYLGPLQHKLKKFIPHVH